MTDWKGYIRAHHPEVVGIYRNKSRFWIQITDLTRFKAVEAVLPPFLADACWSSLPPDPNADAVYLPASCESGNETVSTNTDPAWTRGYDFAFNRVLQAHKDGTLQVLLDQWTGRDR